MALLFVYFNFSQMIQFLKNLDIIFNESNHKLRDLGSQIHTLICNCVAYHEGLPDLRNAVCKEKSIWSSRLCKTVHIDSIPACHLHEIASMNNDSDFDDLKGELDKYVPKYLVGNVKVVRNTKCEGLIRGRMIGATHAICRYFCLQLVVLSGTGRIQLGLHFRWDVIPLSELQGPDGNNVPVKSPTMTGGLFAMNRHYFKYWADTRIYNSLRLAHAWLNEYKDSSCLPSPPYTKPPPTYICSLWPVLSKNPARSD
ncbi:unnamed protein product [Nyctereutes procyonoides]|uniref:(raccoon dog) hypothetical protein n=1 Tax=Nyctereutes procyonoides TaxID=34880 RepID=A0A811YXC4_NYCPR|nr:unnamed protein product [Nyctereutes procyonoides]